MKFLYRTEHQLPQNVEPGEAYAISDLELASRLAFFLWSRGPDEQLLALAESNELSKPDVYEAQIERMLADPRSKTLVTNFAFQWLGVRNLETALPDERLYPYFDVDLKDAFEREMELFLDSILRYRATQASSSFSRPLIRFSTSASPAITASRTCAATSSDASSLPIRSAGACSARAAS
jgi:hypothetical protein